MSRLAFPAIIPVRNAAKEELAAAARASLPLQSGRRLADWFGDDPVDAESGWRSAHAQRDAAETLSLVARGDAITDETTSRLRWIYEVAYHAGYLHTSEDHELIHRAGTLCDAAEHTDREIIADWCRALDALFAHGVEDALPSGADPAAGEDAAYLTTGVQIAAGIEGDTEAAWLSAMSLPAIRPYAVAELNRRAGRDAQHDPLPGLEPFECDAVVMASQAIVAGYATGGSEGVAAAVRQAAAPGSETVLFEQMWRSRHLIAAQALMTAGKLHPDKKIAKAARAASMKAASVRNSPRGG